MLTILKSTSEVTNSTTFISVWKAQSLLDVFEILERKEMMTELEKKNLRLPFCFDDPEIDALKLHAVKGCEKLEAVDVLDAEGKQAAIRQLLGSVGDNPNILPGFICDNGRNIHAGRNLLINYHVTILDVDEVHIGDYCMIGPGVLIATVNHPLTPAGRRKHLSLIKPVFIGNDVWIGGNATILPGVRIGNNCVIAAGAVVTRDVPDNTLVAGVPARAIRKIENNLTGDEK